MKNLKENLIFLFVAIFLVIFVNIIFAGTFTSNVIPNTANASTYQVLNFSVNNTDTTNIIQVNITVPVGFGFVINSNTTTAINTSFSNVSNIMIWTNTSGSGFIWNGFTEYFSINVSVPSVANGTPYNFTVTTLDNINTSSLSTNVTVTVLNSTNQFPQYSSDSVNNTEIGLTTEFRLKWTDDVGLNWYIFSTNNTGTWVNDSLEIFSGTTNWSNVTKTLNNTVGIVIGWRVYANDTSANLNTSEIFTFVTSDVGGASIAPTYSNLYSSVTNNTTVTVGDAINLSVLWNDNFNLSYYMNASSANGSSFVNGSWAPFVSTNWSNFSIVYPSSGAGGNYSVKIYANDSHGNENVTGMWVWYNNTFVPGSPFVPGGGSGDIPIYLVNRKKGNVNITITSVDAGDKQSVAILKTEDMSFRRVIVYAKNALNNIKLMVTKLEGLPASVTRDISGETYHHINITTENFADADLNNATIEFAIPKSWLEDNNIDKSNITLYRWRNHNWNALPTTQISETDTEIFYSAVTSGFSYFVIGTIEIVTAAPTACVENWICTEWSSCVDGKETKTCTDSHDCGTEDNKPETSRDCILEQILVGAEDLGLGGILVASGIILAIVVMILLLVKEKKIDLSFLKRKKKFKYKYKSKRK